MGKQSGKNGATIGMATPEKAWPKNQAMYRDEAAQWIDKAIAHLHDRQYEDALFAMTTAIRWLEKAGAVTKPMSIETLNLFANFRSEK